MTTPCPYPWADFVNTYKAWLPSCPNYMLKISRKSVENWRSYELQKEMKKKKEENEN